MDVTTLVEPDRVHKTVYTDQDIFDREMANIWESTWVYCGHESQLQKTGDYATVQIGRQPMIMVRQHGQNLRVLYNSCPHRGVQVSATGRATPDHLRLFLSCLDLSPRRPRARDPAAAWLRRHPHDA